MDRPTNCYDSRSFGYDILDFCFWADEDDGRIISELWTVIGKAGVPESLDEYAAKQGLVTPYEAEQPEFAKWRNVWCDVHSAHAHIHAKRDVFVTMNSKDFQRNSVELAALGMSRVLTPRDFLATL